MPAIETTLEQLAAQYGYPASVQGYTPNQAGYWLEPGLPLQPLTAQLNKYGEPMIWQPARIEDLHMLPRFRPGAVVNLLRVRHRQELTIGLVYGFGSYDCFFIGRLLEISGPKLTFEYDNSPKLRSLVYLPESPTTTLDIYEVTHYLSPAIPVEVYEWLESAHLNPS